MGSTALAPTNPATADTAHRRSISAHGHATATPRWGPTTTLDIFITGRPRLFGIAYRILGSSTEAEDVVQDVWLRWQSSDRADVREPMAFLATATTRAAINVLQSARVRRETAIEPLLSRSASSSDDPSEDAEREEALEHAIFMMMQRLTSAERAAYVLRVGFDYPYPDIASIVGATETAARQLVSRAGKHLRIARAREVDRSAHQRLYRAIRNAAGGGDATALEKVLTDALRA